jgi:hypothetical protein
LSTAYAIILLFLLGLFGVSLFLMNRGVGIRE